MSSATEKYATRQRRVTDTNQEAPREAFGVDFNEGRRVLGG